MKTGNRSNFRINNNNNSKCMVYVVSMLTARKGSLLNFEC